ncbi:MAG TPA: hypothetical protein VF218_14200, partial [Acidothermaceae bacterium]
LGTDSGFSTGDQVSYLKGASSNTAVGGLTDGDTYYVRDTGGGNFAFYDSKDDAIAGGSTGLVDITGTGTGSGHSFVLGNQKSDQRLAGISASGADSLSASAPTASDVLTKEAAAQPAIHGTGAKIESGTQVTAGGAVQVKANENLHVNTPLGAVGIGAVGVGVAVGVVTVQSNVSATAGGDISSTGAVTLDSALYENIDFTSVAVGGGAVGLGASVGVVSDSSTNEAKLLDYATVNGASALTVEASTTQVVTGTTAGAGGGGVAIGASFIIVDLGGDGSTSGFTKAEIGDYAQIGNTDAVGDVTVTASQKVDVDSQSYGLAGGAIAGAVNFSFVTVDPWVIADIGSHASVNATGDIKVEAGTDIDASSKSLGVALSVVGSVAGSFARSEVSPIVHAYVGGNADVATTGGNLTVRATNNDGKASRGAKAKAFAGSGGALLGASGAIAWAKNDADVEAWSDTGSSLSADKAVEISTNNVATATATAAGLGGGFVGIGIAGAEADTGGSSSAYAEGKLYGDSVKVDAEAANTAHSSAAALAGGLIAVSFNYSHADMSGTVSATLGGGARVSADHNVQVLANSTNTGHAEGLGVTVGGIAIGGMETSASVGAGDSVIEVVAGLDNGAHIDGAQFAQVQATNGNTLSVEGQSAGGGAISVTGSDASTHSD